jgi:oligopeptide/dipeptide ABC transporter ATP-binding protein
MLVLYRAHVVEAGAVQPIVTAPQHPYTRLLISSIPRAEVARDWLTAEDANRHVSNAAGAAGCCFADRCPEVEAGCLTALPALRQTEPQRAVACVQYHRHAALPAGNLDKVLLV